MRDRTTSRCVAAPPWPGSRVSASASSSSSRACTEESLSSRVSLTTSTASSPESAATPAAARAAAPKPPACATWAARDGARAAPTPAASARVAAVHAGDTAAALLLPPLLPALMTSPQCAYARGATPADAPRAAAAATSASGSVARARVSHASAAVAQEMSRAVRRRAARWSPSPRVSDQAQSRGTANSWATANTRTAGDATPRAADQ